jgi:GNAT superfamily N-acetyltransferase
LEFRAATPDDMNHVVEMRIAYLTEINDQLSEKETGALLKRLPDYYRRHMEKDFFAYLALEDGKPVSTVYLLIVERPANLSFITGRTGILLNVFTYPEYRKRGLASRLLQMAIEDAKKLNVSNIELQATDMGIPVYEKLGFMHKQSRYTYMEYRFDAPDDASAG